MDGTRLEGKGVVGNAMRRKTKVSFCAAPPICHVKSIIPPSQNCQLVLDKEPVTLGSQHAWATLSVLDDLDLPYTIETHDLPELKERVRSSASASTSSAERENGGRKLNQTRQRRNETTTAGLRLTDRQLTSHIKNCYDVPELHALWLGHASSLNSMHVAAFLHRLGKCHDVSKPCNLSLTLNMLSHLDEAFSLHLEDYSAREVSMAFWSWGTLSHRPPHHVWTSVCHAITEGADRNKGVSSLLAHAAPQSIAMLAWGMVKISGCSQSEAERSPMDTLEENQVAQKKPSDENEELVWDAIEAASRQSLRSLPPRDLANIVWSFASAGRHNVAFFNLLADASIARINDFTPQDLSNTAWAFATVRHPYKPLFEAIAGASLRILHAFTPQAIANLMWAFAVVRIDNAEELMDVASKEAMRRLESFLPAHLSMMAWALARSAGRSGSRASSDTTVQGLSSIARVASMRLSSFKSKEIALVLWSLSWAKGNDDNLLFDSAPSELLARLKRQSLSWQVRDCSTWELMGLLVL